MDWCFWRFTLEKKINIMTCMQKFNIPDRISTIIFDIDGTLYTSDEFVFEQVDVQLRHYAHLNNISEDEARMKMKKYRDEWSKKNGGKQISLGNAFTAFGVSIEESIRWRNQLMEPEKYLNRNEDLRKVLLDWQKKYKFICVTNNPVGAAKKILTAIGVEDILTDIVGLDTCRKSKPSTDVLEEALRRTGSNACECVSIGDRYDIDIALPLEFGMGGVLVSGVEDVCKLDF